MKRTLAFLPAALVIFCLLSGCAKTEEAAAPAPTPQIIYVTVTPAPESEAPLGTDELPLVVDPGQASFPGGLDDDGRGGGEYGICDENDPRFEGVEPVETVELTADRQYEANIFLSNFAEQNFQFYMYDLDLSQILGPLVRFAHIWYKINDQSGITYGELDGQTWEILSADRLCQVTDRFFPFELTEEDIERYYRPEEHSFYRDGLFYFEAADGEAHNRIAVADSITRMSTGVLFITFTEYDVDLDTYFDFEGSVPRSYYELTAEQAAAKSDLTAAASGRAIVEPHTYNGRSTYRLIEYTAL